MGPPLQSRGYGQGGWGLFLWTHAGEPHLWDSKHPSHIGSRGKREPLEAEEENKQIMLIHATGYYATIKAMFLQNFNDRECLGY